MVNTDVPWPTLSQARQRVLQMQTKLHRWAGDDPSRRFDDLFNLVYDPHFLTLAWERVAGNTGARTAGIDHRTVRWIEARVGVAALLRGIREELKSRVFRPVPVRQVMIPKAGGKLRRLGIPTVTDRVVQATLKLVTRTHLRGGLRPVLLRVSPEPAGPRRDRRDPPLRLP
jgi:RNA-directed DNA polymerase